MQGERSTRLLEVTAGRPPAARPQYVEIGSSQTSQPASQPP
jgi:hypothetical protein